MTGPVASSLVNEHLPPVFGRIPDAIARALVGRTVIRETIGKSGSWVFLLTDGGAAGQYLKVAQGVAAEQLSAERVRLDWLAGRLPVPRVLEYVDDRTAAYLLLSVIRGVDATSRTLASDVARLARLLADGLRRIHAIPVEGCPFDCRVKSEIERARANLDLGRVDETDFDLDRRGRTASELFVEVERTRPRGEDLVFTHGDYSLPNVIVHEKRVSGFVDVGRAGVGDRYRDLAIAARSLAKNWGPYWVPELLAEYGLEKVDTDKVEFYRSIDEFF
jgi:aminoglycoside phosphotransferase